MDVVGLATNLRPCAAHLARYRGKQVSKQGKVSEDFSKELRAEEQGTTVCHCKEFNCQVPEERKVQAGQQSRAADLRRQKETD